MKKNMKEGVVKVDFNNVRERAVLNYNSLVRTLNAHRVNGGYINMPCDSIERIMVELRQDIAIIAMTYEEGREDFKNVIGDNEVEIFNPFPEEGKDE